MASSAATAAPPAPTTPTTPPGSASTLGESSDRRMFNELVRAGDTVSAATPCRLRTTSGRVDVNLLLLSHTTGGQREHAVLMVEKERLAILRAIPVVPSLQVALEQVPPSPSASFFAQSDKPKIEISIRGPDSSAILQFPGSSSDVLRVHAIVKELRRVVGAAGELGLLGALIPVTSPLSHRWLAYYPVTDAAGSAESPGSDTTDDKSTDKLSTSASTETEKSAESGDDAADADAELYPNPYADGFNRQAYLRKRLFSKQAEWSTRSGVSVRVVTYNVNGRLPPEGTRELAPVLGYGAEDILVVGLQEADLRSQALLMSQGDERAAAWETAIFQGLREKEDAYEKVAMEQYVGVILFVFAKTHVRPHIRMVQGATKAIGLWGIGGNKAGVAFRMKVHDTTVCFVNSHLAAFASQLARRRLDYQALRSGLTFPLLPGQHPPTEAYYPDDGQLTVDDADVLFWFGDLNFRVDLQDREVTALVEAKDWEKLVHADQLTCDIADKLSFEDFTEARIDFKPSYKYVHGSTTYDPKRAPAYCDRVLYKSRYGEVAPNTYTCHDLLWSDHLPVSCTFTLDARIVDDTKRAAALVGAQCELDKLDELYRPSLRVDMEDVDFGEVSYLRPVRREVILRNDGLVPATYSFRAPAPGKSICMPFFWPFPCSATVQPGKEVSLYLTACVDETMSAALTTGEDMNDVLVLQVQGGKESFITLRAGFLPTIVGLPLDVLPELPDVIRDVPLAVRKTLLDQEDEQGRADGEGEKRARESEVTETGPEVNLPSEDGGVSNGAAAAIPAPPEPRDGGREPITEATDVSQNGATSGTTAPSNGKAGKAALESTAGDAPDASSEASASEPASSQPSAAPQPKTQPEIREPQPVSQPVTPRNAELTAHADIPPKTPPKTHLDAYAETPPKTPPKDVPGANGNGRGTPADPMAPVENIPPSSSSPGTPKRVKSKSKKRRGRTTALTKPPREVWRLLERLMDVGPGVEALWVRGAPPNEILDVIDALDTGSPLPGSAHAAAAALLHVLAALPGHLVPDSQKWNCRLIMSRDDAYAVVERIPGVNANVLIGLASVARLCASGDDLDKDTIAALAMAVFGAPAVTRVGLIIGLVEG